MDDFNPDEFLAQAGQQPPPATEMPSTDEEGFNPDEFLAEANQEKYGGFSQQAIAGAEGLAKGFAGPLATGAEKLAGVPAEDIQGRAEANPLTHGAGQVLGLGAGLLTGTGEAAVMTGVGKGAAELAGLSELAATAPLIHRVGSAAVTAAAENAVLQGGDEISKNILQDPESSAESAIANIGMAAALGGAGGAFITGAVSPLWNATAGPKLEGLLKATVDRMNGVPSIAPAEGVQEALTTLGVDASPLQKAALSDANTAISGISALRRAENPETLEAIHNISEQSANAVAQSLGTDLESVRTFDKNEAGHNLLDAWTKEYNDKYEPLAAAFNKRNTEAAGISIPDEARLSHFGSMIETGMEKYGTDSPYYKLFEEYGDRLLARDTVGKLDALKTEINNRIKGLRVGGDHNTINALQDIKTSLGDFQESQITKLARSSEKAGLEGAAKAGTELLEERAATNKNYAEFAKMSDELTNHLGVGGFRGAGTLEGKLTNAVAAEDLLKKFSIKGNIDFAPFLQKNFPETYQAVLANERKEFLKSAVLQAAKKGDFPIDIRSLSDKIAKAQAGEANYLKTILSEDSIKKVEAAKTVLGSIISPKDSGTPAGIAALFKHMPGSAMAGVGLLSGHSPIMSGLLGETMSFVGKTVPEAMKLSYLKLLASEQPVNAPAFKAMAEFLHNSIRGQTTLMNATKNVFKAGAQVLSTHMMPAKADREKLDKIVTKMDDAPDKIYSLQNGHVGHYLPAHQTGLTEASTRALSYLQSLKPRPQRLSPMDAEVQPSPAETARYNRALDIAQQPAVILQHIKNGTLQPSDLHDLGAMYPGLYRQMANQLSTQMGNANADEVYLPYKARMSLSLFLGQPLDSTMSPTAIQAAQASYLPKQGGGPPQSAPNSGSPSKMGKTVKSYQTPLQASEARRTTSN